MGISQTELNQNFILNERVSVVTLSTGRQLAATDFAQYIRTEGTSALTVSVPASTSATPVGFWTQICQRGTGKVTLVADSGVSVAVRTSGNLNIGFQGGLVTLRKVAAETWDLAGDVSVT
jgi:hypothetical protein